MIMKGSEEMDGNSHEITRKDNGEPPQNLVKDGPRELLKQKIEKMQTRVAEKMVAEKMVLENARQCEKYFLKLAQRYYSFDAHEYHELSREEKEALFEIVRTKAQKRMRFLFCGNGIFIGGVFFLSLTLSPLFSLSLALLIFNLPIAFGGLGGEIDFLAYKKYAALLFSHQDKKEDSA